MTGKKFIATLVMLGWKTIDTELINIWAPPSTFMPNWYIQYVTDNEYMFIKFDIRSGTRTYMQEDANEDLLGEPMPPKKLLEYVVELTND